MGKGRTPYPINGNRDRQTRKNYSVYDLWDIDGFHWTGGGNSKFKLPIGTSYEFYERYYRDGVKPPDVQELYKEFNDRWNKEKGSK